ncbi:MAG: cytochrome c [Gemmatimonadaceae bacterium]
MGWTVAALGCMYVAPRGTLAAQDASADSVRTTLAGVYSAAQAARGKDVYTESCLECHTTADHSSPQFQNSWIGHLLSELVDYMRREMPQNNPGSLTAEQYASLTAYILSLNAMPAGDADLPSDSLHLSAIRFVVAVPGADALSTPPPPVADSVPDSLGMAVPPDTLPAPVPPAAADPLVARLFSPHAFLHPIARTLP